MDIIIQVVAKSRTRVSDLNFRLGRLFVMIFHKTKHTLMVQSSNYAPWIYASELETCVHSQICTQVFIAAVESLPRLEESKVPFS